MDFKHRILAVMRCFRYACMCRGGVTEWLMVPVLKTGNGKPFVGSNPTPSANY